MVASTILLLVCLPSLGGGVPRLPLHTPCPMPQDYGMILRSWHVFSAVLLGALGWAEGRIMQQESLLSRKSKLIQICCMLRVAGSERHGHAALRGTGSCCHGELQGSKRTPQPNKRLAGPTAWPQEEELMVRTHDSIFRRLGTYDSVARMLSPSRSVEGEGGGRASGPKRTMPPPLQAGMPTFSTRHTTSPR
jgi:hypothetical protein